MSKIFKNKDIFKIGQLIEENFQEDDSIYIPIHLNFYIQKNFDIILSNYQEILSARKSVIEHYGILNEEDGSYSFENEDLEKANKELDKLLEEKQELNITMLPLSSILEVKLSSSKLKTILFMIEDDCHNPEAAYEKMHGAQKVSYNNDNLSTDTIMI